MLVRDLFVLLLIVYIPIIKVCATDVHSDSEEDDDEYRQFKRFFFGSKSTSTARSPAAACASNPCEHGGTCLSVDDDYLCKCTNDYDGKNCQTKSYSPSHLDNHCRPNICNAGRCISLKAKYYCQCFGDHYGERCEKRFQKRGVSKRQSFFKLMNQMKRVYGKQINSDEYKNDGKAYYDYRNGIYF